MHASKSQNVKILTPGKIRGYNRQDPLWQGIEIEGNPNSHQLIHNVTGYSPNQGIVQLYNNTTNPSTISHAWRGILTATTASGFIDHSSTAGIIIAEGAVFKNNVEDVVFLDRHSATTTSKIKACQFISTEEISRYSNGTVIAPTVHLYVVEHESLKIEGCVFKNEVGLPGYRCIGIYGWNSTFMVTDRCTNVACTTGVNSLFQNMSIGIKVKNINPVYSSITEKCDFTDCGKAALYDNSNSLLFHNNTVSSTGLNQDGVYLYHCKHYKIRSNTFEGNTNGYGVLAYDSKIGAHEIYRNTFEGWGVAILAEDDNGDDAQGLKMNCNNFVSGTLNLFDISLTPVKTVPVVSPMQSFDDPDTKLWALNQYGASTSYWTNCKWDIPSSNLQSITHVNSDHDTDNPLFPTARASFQVAVIVRNETPNFSTDCPEVTSTLPAGSGVGGSQYSRVNSVNEHLKTILANNSQDWGHDIASTISSKITAFQFDSLELKNDSIIQTLIDAGDNLHDADVDLVFTHLRVKDFTSATSVASNLPSSKCDWKSFFSHLIEVLQEPGGIQSLLTNSSEMEYFVDYAGNPANQGYAVAQNIVEELDEELEHEYPVVFPSGFGQRIASVEKVASVGPFFVLFPNPAVQELKVKGVAVDFVPQKMRIFNSLGQLVFYSNFEKEATIDVSYWNDGLYHLQILDANDKSLHRQNFAKGR